MLLLILPGMALGVLQQGALHIEELVDMTIIN